MNKNSPKPTAIRTIIMGIVILLLALAVRLPYLNQVPCWSAGNENNIALSILEGARPLTNQNPHLGALSPYLVAAALKVFGMHSWVPRLIPFIFGLLTVLLTWRLGVRTYNQRTGVLAAVLMSTAWYHVVFSSHYPWSNSLTPFFATVFLLVLTRFLPDKDTETVPSGGWFLPVFAGILFGLGMQTHPEMVTLIPVIILVLIVRWQSAVRWLKTPVPWLMVMGGAMGYGNMLYYNIVNRFQSVEFGLTYPEYALTKEYTATSVTGNYIHEFLYLPRIILGLHDDGISWSHYAAHPLIWIFWILVVSGIVLSIRQKRYLVPAAFLSSFLIIPAINSNYSLNLGRYLVFMFPVALILAGQTLDRLLSLKPKPVFTHAVRWGVLVVLVVLVLFPLHQIRDYYAYCDANGLTRERFHRLDEIISEAGYQNPLIVLDQETGDANDFLQFLREEGYRCLFPKFRDHRGDPVDLTEIKQTIETGRAIPTIDGVILVIAPWNRYRLLDEFSVSRLLGQVDVRFEDGFVDFYRVYGLHPSPPPE